MNIIEKIQKQIEQINALLIWAWFALGVIVGLMLAYVIVEVGPWSK